jgi:hypothetical protein
MGSIGKLSDPKEYQNIFHWAETQKDGKIPSFKTRRNDPYEACPPSNLFKNDLLTCITVPSWLRQLVCSTQNLGSA